MRVGVFGAPEERPLPNLPRCHMQVVAHHIDPGHQVADDFEASELAAGLDIPFETFTLAALP